MGLGAGSLSKWLEAAKKQVQELGPEAASRTRVLGHWDQTRKARGVLAGVRHTCREPRA